MAVATFKCEFPRRQAMLKLAALSELRGHMESAIMDLEKEEQ